VLPVSRLFVLTAPALLLSLAGCASKTGAAAAAPAGSAPAPAAARAPRQDQQLITRDVIRGTEYTNLFDVIQALRSNWLRVKDTGGIGTGDPLQVYLDNQRVGGVEELRTMVPSSVLSVRYYDPIAASARWGLNHNGGAIYVLTQKK
jgi:hypothetical protein